MRTFKIIGALSIAVLLTAQQGSCATTGSTQEQRCAKAQAGLSAAKRISDDEDRQERILLYKDLVTIYCM